MSTIPALERALDEAAHRHYGHRRRRLPRRWRLAVPALAAGIAASVVLLGNGEPTPKPPPEPRILAVPAATLERSRALTAAPDIPERNGKLVPHANLPAVAAEYERRTPYPPGGEDDFDWAATPPGPYDMSSINYRPEIQRLVEFRASCLWQSYWLAAAAHPGARRAAVSILADVPSWPSQRRPSSAAHAERLARSAAAGDAAAVAKSYRGDCSRMKTPWS